ncbi:MAG: M3 family peptidase, partial [Deltaproteobacteria bacterium]
MRNKMIRRLTMLAIALCACATEQKKPAGATAETTSPKTTTAMNDTKSQNVLLAPWQGPNGGEPPFGKFKVQDIKSAVEEGMTLELQEIDQIAGNPEAPSFDNTIVAMERAGQPLTRATTVYGIYTATMNDDEMQKIQSELS